MPHQENAPNYKPRLTGLVEFAKTQLDDIQAEQFEGMLSELILDIKADHGGEIANAIESARSQVASPDTPELYDRGQLYGMSIAAGIAREKSVR